MTSAAPAPTPSRRIGLLGGGGKTGRAVAAALRGRGLPADAVVPLVRSGRAGPGERELDLTRDASVLAALTGVGVVYLVVPNLHPDEVGIVRRTIAAAREHGIDRIVYHSVLRPGLRAMPHHGAKADAEELLWSSGLDVTVLQPSAYAQNLLGCRRDDRLEVPYAVEAPFSLVDLDDVAQATARVLTEPGHGGASYELAGPVTSVAELARGWGLAAARVRTAAGPGTAADYPTRALAAMFDWYDRHGLVGNPGVLGWLLGRPPRDPAQVLADGLLGPRP